jgi:hypothetical protein
MGATSPVTLLDQFGQGLHPDISGEDYYARVLGEANSGSLKLILQKSLLHYHYWATQQLTDEEQAAEKAAHTFGRAYHCALLEPDRFAEESIVEPYFGSLQSSRVRAERDHWRDRNADRLILTAKELRTLEGMGRALRAHPLIGDLVRGGGETEMTIVWRDPDTGLPCKARLDWVNRVFFFVLDPKSCKDASREGFARACASFFYHLQAVHYLEGCKAVGLDIRKFFFIAQEKEPPYACALYELDAPDEELGYRLRTKAMRMLADAMAMNHWPGLNNDNATRLRLPAYAHYDLDTLTE